MRSVNKVILIGNVVRDPEFKTTTSGHSFVSFVLATNREWFSESGNQSLAEFHKIVAWGKLAELCTKFLKKGKFIYIEGYLKTRSWEDENGQKMFRTEVVAQDMIMLNKRGDFDGDDKGGLDSFAPMADDNMPPIEELKGNGRMDLEGSDI